MAVLSSVLVLIGVFLSLYGTRQFRYAVRRLLTSIARSKPEPVVLTLELAEEVDVAYSVGLYTGPSNATEAEKRLHRIEARIDWLERQVADHPHPNIDRKLKRLADTHERTRADLDAKVREIARQAKTAEWFNMAGLLVVAAGTVFAVIDALS